MAKAETIGQVKANLRAANAEAEGYLNQIGVLKEEIARQVDGARADEQKKIVMLAQIIEALSQLVIIAYTRS